MRKITMLTVLVCFGFTVFAQSADEESIKKTVQAEADARVARNYDTWKALWLQDSNVVSTFASRSAYSSYKGWDSLSAEVERDWKANPKPIWTQYKTGNVNIRQNGNLAVVDYDAMVAPTQPEPDQFPYSDVFHIHTFETLVKDGGQWKVASRVTTQPESYNTNNAHDIETDINNTAYRLLDAHKINEALELFKLNAKLFPASWNVYDSLGDAYAQAGNKKLAIANYEKSMKLNPKSETGPAALAKLKQE